VPDVSRGPPSKSKTPQARGGVGEGGDVEMSSDDDFDDDGVAVSISFDDEDLLPARGATKVEGKDVNMGGKQKEEDGRIAGGDGGDGVSGIGVGGKGPQGGIGKAEVEAALSRFGNIKLFSLDDEGAKGEEGDGDGGLGAGYASGGSMASLDHHGYR
jgi:hypothetical protein